MRHSILIHRYTKAFLDLAIQNGIADKALDDLLLVKTTFEENKELELLIHRPFVSTQHKINIVNKIFKDKVDTLTLNLVNLLIEKKRDAIITDIYYTYREMYLDYKKVAVVTVTTAIALDEHTADRIVNILRHKIVGKDSIQVNNVIDKSIIGGFKVSYMDYEYDASIVKTLRRLHSVFEENLFVKEF